VAAHYRTEPTDLARLLDAPNLRVRALLYGDRVAAIALLAREGGLPPASRREVYEGARIRGHMLPDVLTSQLRDGTAGIPLGYRVVRIATHHAVRGRGLGSRLLREIHAELGDTGGAGGGSSAGEPSEPPGPSGPPESSEPSERSKAASPDEPPEPADWFGVGYGATPRLLRFWRQAGYRTVHLSTTRNDASGEHSALMLRPASPAGRDLATRHGEFFARRIRDVLSDALRDLEPDVARCALAACDAAPAVDLEDHDWRIAAAAAFGPGLYDAAPGAFRDLALRALVDGAVDLSARRERLLVAKVLQGRPWTDVAEELGYVSTSECMRDLGAAFRPIVDAYGGTAAREERDRYE
jgi:tRNA(Met) cytidine acetyltransferase